MSAKQDHPKRSVLCIEDERFISELYVRALQASGYKAKVVADGDTGITEATSGKYDIILLDLMIPGTSGMEVLRKLKADPATAITSKIIITTNLDVGEERRDEMEKLADGYIIKAEITPGQLVDFIDQIKIEDKN